MFRLHGSGMRGCEEQVDGTCTRVTAYFNEEKTARDAATALRPLSESSIPVSTVAFQDWNARWRESMRPATLADGWFVSPVWLPPPGSPRHWIKIEPAMAFGTGHHETTRLAAAALIADRNLLKHRRVLDIGTGSGVLCFVGRLCGARYCLGVDIDVWCLENIAQNRTENAGTGRTGFLIGSTGSLKNGRHFDCIVMNMIASESVPLMGQCASLLNSGGRLIWSGILADESREAIATAGAFGFSLKNSSAENEWWCGIFELNK